MSNPELPPSTPAPASDPDKIVFLGLNQKGTITFVILLFLCAPICWIPFLVGSMKGKH